MSVLRCRVAFVILSVVLTAAPAAAQPLGLCGAGPGPCGPPWPPPIPGIWRNPHLVAFLQLSSRQVLELKQIDVDLKAGLAPLEKKLVKALTRMEQAFNTWPVYEAAVKARAVVVARLQRQRLLLLVHSRVRVHNMLSQDQLNKLASLLPPRPPPHPMPPPPGGQVAAPQLTPPRP